jgi:hypothetical protein
MEAIVQPGYHPRGVAERWMLSDITDLFAVNPDLAAVIKAF